MTFYSKVGHWNNKTNGTTDTIAGLGFTPVALILWAGNQSATGWQSISSAINVMFGIGFSAANGAGPTMQYGSSCSASEAHINSTRPKYLYQAAYPLILYNYAGTLLLQISSVAFNSDGFVATYSTTPSTAYTIYYLALGGTDITGAAVKGWQSITSATNQAVTLDGTSFKPTAVLHISNFTTTVPPYGIANSIGTSFLGAMDSAGNQWSVEADSLYHVGIGTPSIYSCRTQVTNACISHVSVTALTSATGGNTPSDVASYVSMDTGGFTVDWTTKSAAGQYIYSLALAGPAITVGNKAKTGQTQAVTDTVSGLGFTPVAVLATTDSYPASASNIEHSRFTLGASDGTHQGVLTFTDESNLGTATYTVDTNYNDSTNAIIVANATAGDATDVAAPINNFVSGAFDIAWGTDTTTDATQVCYVAFGAGGTSISVNLTAPTATTTTGAPTFAQATTLTAPTAATTTTTAPAQTLATTLIKPTSTTTTNAPTQDVGPGLITPTGTTATNAPVIAGISQVTLTTPTATTATGAPTFAQATTLTAPAGTTTTYASVTDVAPAIITPTATTATDAISQADLATILAAPTASTETYSPISSGASSILLTTPTATTTTGAPSQDIATTLLVTPTALTETDTPYQAIEIILITPTATSATSGLIITQWGAIEVLRATYDQNPISLEGTLKNTDMLTAVNKVTTELLSATYNLETPSLTAVSKNTGVLTAISEVVL